MSYPCFLRVAFILGINPYARIASHKIYQVCGLLVIAYDITVSLIVLSIVSGGGVNSVAIFTIIYHTFITTHFTVVRLLDSHSITFYDEILSEINSSSRKKVYAVKDFWCLALFLAVLLELAIYDATLSIIFLAFLVACILNTLVPLISMVQFSLCCTSVQSSYRRLQNDLLQSVPRTSSFTLRRIRIRQLDTADRVRDISSVFGVCLLLYTLMVQLILLDKVDNLVYGIASKNCGSPNNCPLTLASFCGYFVNLWYFSYCPFMASCQHKEALATLMDLDTRDMDLPAMQEMAMLAEDLHSRETRFSAAGCFYVGFNVFYSVIGILFSYVVIIGPMAYNKNKSLWFKSNE